jgi:hypothetical protein
MIDCWSLLPNSRVLVRKLCSQRVFLSPISDDKTEEILAVSCDGDGSDDNGSECSG